MSYRKINVNNQIWTYSIGEKGVKIKKCAVNKLSKKTQKEILTNGIKEIK